MRENRLKVTSLALASLFALGTVAACDEGGGGMEQTGEAPVVEEPATEAPAGEAPPAAGAEE